MSVIGIDFGTQNCVIATVVKGTVQVVRNDLSDRLTPTLVGYGPRQRLLGEEAQTQLKSNFRNICQNMRHMLGRSLKSLSAAEQKELADASLCPIDADEKGLAAYKISYRGDPIVVNATRAAASMLRKLADTSERTTGCPVREVVVSVPGWYTDVHREAVLRAAEIAGLTCLRVVNEHAAVALDFGIYRSASFSETDPTCVAFVGAGQGGSFCSVVRFLKGRLEVLSAETDTGVSGRVLDDIIAQEAARRFKKNTGIDVYQDPKGKLKLEEQAQKVKKMLSANKDAQFTVECLSGDEDISFLFTRDEFEEMCASVKERATQMISLAVSRAGVPVQEIDSVEIVGGCTRVPFLQLVIANALSKTAPTESLSEEQLLAVLSKTLSSDEAVARGCALQAAMLSPLFKVKDFQVVDTISHDLYIRFSQQATESYEYNKQKRQPEGGCHKELLAKAGDKVPLFNTHTFYRTSAELQITASIVDRHAVETDIGVFKISVPVSAEGPPSKVKVKMGVNGSSMFALVGAYLSQQEEYTEYKQEKRLVETPAPDAEQGGAAAAPEEGAEAPQPAGGDAAAPDAAGAPAAAPEAAPAAPQEPKYETVDVPVKATRTVRTELRVEETRPHPFHDAESIKEFKAAEATMAAYDREVRELMDKRNELESKIYSWRSDLRAPGSRLFAFSDEVERTNIGEALSAGETWLRDNEETASLVDLVEKIDSLRAIIAPCEDRKLEKERAAKAEQDRLLKEQEDKRREAEKEAADAKAAEEAAAAAAAAAAAEVGSPAAADVAMEGGGSPAAASSDVDMAAAQQN
eukprot:GHVU01229454.1.p1 GENE.GHVU01229454.1~~GHVU01229454.1.p1  ORF type:complete len:806 (+),score=237.97 GHVU01229454.1:255-2672(+)